MPATSLFGRRLRQLAADNTLFYFMIALVQLVWLFIYWIGIVAFDRPETCDPGIKSSGQQWGAVFACLALFIAQAGITVAAVLLTMRGTPLEPESKHRWVRRLSYAYLASIPVNIGLVAWADWVVRAGDGSCWSSDNRSMPSSVFFGAWGVLLGQIIGIAMSYNQLGDVRHGNSWHSLTRTGASSVLHLFASWCAKHRGPKATLEEVVTELQQLMAGIDADKTDVVAGLACAALLQDEAAEAARGGPTGPQQEGGTEASVQSNAGSAAVVLEVASVAGSSKAGSKADVSGKAAGKAASSAVDTELLAWAEGVCRGAAAAVSEAASTAGAAAASAAEAAEALHWARYATFAYGERQHFWRRGGQGWWATRRQLRAAAAAAAAEGAAPLAGWSKGKPGAAERRGFAAALELVKPSGCQVVWLSPGHEPAGLLPHLVAVDREKQAVVLGIAGNWQRPHAVPHVETALPAWLAGGSSAAAAEAAAGSGDGDAGAKAAAGSGDDERAPGSWVHRDCLEAAEALAAELERCQVLHRLLRPAAAANGNASEAAGAASAGFPAPAGQAAGGLALPDCTGWRLVVSGHGLGAGAAALLALRLQGWQLGPLSVWALGPPAQLCSADVAAALASACQLTTVVVGDDASPRASSAALARLVEQAVVGLARLRYCKTGLVAALVAERLGPARWQGRWCLHGRALRPLSAVPPEALALLQRFRDWQCQQGTKAGVPEPSSLPGRVLWLARLPGQAAATTTASADHYISRLLGVLGELAGPPGASDANAV
ncbi:hypothetical protein ABPG75_003382 [Micractinium tetrahymenae]